VIGNTLEAMGAPRASRGALPLLVDYRPELLCTDCDLAMVKDGLLTQGQGRLCFFGPPGTGKTAFGRHLAEALDRPLLVKRASDLQSKWVGETEQNLARMFQEAIDERAVLLLDEADSFLQDRKGAQRSWEISQVNELLTQMEGFEGIFIASTNLMDSLDGAALRRFDLKIRFDYLKSDQGWAMLQDTARRLGLEPGPDARTALAQLTLLTPGDFANVVRQARLRRIASATDLVARLAAECAAKPEGRRNRIGFQGRS
jgi:SpoVK/Ycf46/Vps4 family AAA+-type ATPase